MSPIAPSIVFAAACLAAVIAQEPLSAASPAAAQAAAEWTEGSGRAASYRLAFAQALEDAVAKAKGAGVAHGAGLRSRLAVVSSGENVPKEWFTGDADLERDWVQQQIADFVQSYEIVKRTKSESGQWDVTLRARVAIAETRGGLFVIDLVDADLRQWELERFEEGAAGAPFATAKGTYEAPSIRDNLRATGVVRVLAKVGGPEAAAADRADKQDQPLVASHRVMVEWQPMQFQSLIEKPNIGRPTTGARPQHLTAASVHVNVRVVDLVQNVEVLERALTITLDVPNATPVDRLDVFAVQLADRAKATVAETIYFALQPPIVMRKWPSDTGGEWLVEVAISKRVAQSYESFAIGNQGSLASPDWRAFGRAAFVGGTDTSCTFRLLDVADPSRIEPSVTEVRPARK